MEESEAGIALLVSEVRILFIIFLAEDSFKYIENLEPTAKLKNIKTISICLWAKYYWFQVIFSSPGFLLSLQMSHLNAWKAHCLITMKEKNQ